LVLGVGAVTARLIGGPRFDGLLVVAAGVGVAVLGLRSLVPHPVNPAPEPPSEPATGPLKDVLDFLAEGICRVDAQGKVSSANIAAARLLGFPPPTLIGKPVHTVLHGLAPVPPQCAEGCLLACLTAKNRTASGEETIFRADGSSFPAEVAYTPILDQGRISGALLSFRDITQRHAMDSLRDEFISTVSHELRTPLTSIRGALGLLSAGALGKMNTKEANLFRIALTNSDRLARLINDILDLERIQSGREPLAFCPVQMADIVRQAIEGMAPVAMEAGVELVHDTTRVEVSGDHDRLLQVLTNLLSNAIKFSPSGAAVSVTLRLGLGGVILSVVDEGRGIPPDKLEEIFGRFHQVDASDSRQKGGTGLGLAICRSIVLQHSGRIWAEQNPLRGSAFRVFLPYQPAFADAGGISLDSLPCQGTLLLADANAATTRPLISAKLSSHGYCLIETTTVEQTLAAAHQGVDAILLDTSLDGMNGWEILPLLRRLDPEARTPIVLVSVESQRSPEDLPAGAEGWVTKPLNERALLAELARVLCGPGENARILVVEDDLALARVIGDVFSHDTIALELVHTLKEAYRACLDFRPNLLVLDIGLPDGDGFSLVEWLRQREDLSHLPLVVYSGRELSPDQRRQLTLGPTHFLAKARVQPQQLEALVLTMLRSSRQVRETLPQTQTTKGGD
jgi:PAS domain S-box-containing protein